jgi:hypothetical protein
MKKITTTLALTHMLSFAGLAFSQTTQAPPNANPGTAAGQTGTPGNASANPNPLGPQNPQTNNSALNPYSSLNRDTAPRGFAPPPGPAVSDRDKVSCPPGMEAAIQGTRLICITRSNPPTDDQVNPDSRPTDSGIVQ